MIGSLSAHAQDTSQDEPTVEPNTITTTRPEGAPASTRPECLQNESESITRELRPGKSVDGLAGMAPIAGAALLGLAAPGKVPLRRPRRNFKRQPN